MITLHRTILTSRSMRFLLTVVAWILTILALRLLVGGFVVSGDSMFPSLVSGDLLLVARYHPGVHGRTELSRYDVVVFRRAEDRRNALLAKRVVGLPGEAVQMHGGQLFVDGRAIREPYALASGARASDASIEMLWQLGFLEAPADAREYFPTRDDWGPVRIPAGNYFVLGDNRDATIDSREMGFVAVESVHGVAKRVLLSHDRSCCSPREILRGFRTARIGHRIGEVDARETSHTSVTISSGGF